MAWTFIRATSYLQNRSTTHAPEVRDRDELLVPAGTGRTAFVDARDVAARAPTVRSHEGTAGILTGPAASPTTCGGALAARPGPRELHPRPRIAWPPATVTAS
jgi:uncharacterized protein YbjT (DUF2867 family)